MSIFGLLMPKFRILVQLKVNFKAKKASTTKCTSLTLFHQNFATDMNGLRNSVDRSDSLNRSLVSDRSKVVIFNLRALHSLSKLTSATIQINNSFRVTRMTVKTSLVKIARMNEVSYL